MPAGRGDVLDVVLLVLLAVYAVRGFRRGLLLSVFSVGGALLGGWLGSRFAPELATRIIAAVHPGALPQAPLLQRLLGLVIVLLAAVVVELAAVRVATALRAAVRLPGLLVVDGAGGALAQVLALLVVLWVLGTVLASAPFPRVSAQVRRSEVLALADRAAPGWLRVEVAGLSRLLQDHALPPVLFPFSNGGLGRLVPAAPPNAGVVPPALRAAGGSIVKVLGTAPSCSRRSEGSGFVYAAEHVLTNAHVVAGARSVTVSLPGTTTVTLTARVVLYDPQRDVAVLDVPGLRRPALPFAGAAGAGADAVVAGYPNDGPLHAVAARVRDRSEVTGPNIYQDRTVTRDVYTLRADVQPGNSGGPLLDPHGAVYGVVFARGTDSSATGYALTDAEVLGDARSAERAAAPVSTQACD